MHPELGTPEDLDRLLAEARARDLKVVLDFVPNGSTKTVVSILK